MKYTTEELSLLDTFAGRALMGIISGREKDRSEFNFIGMSELSYEIAEAMLEHRKKYLNQE